MFSALAQAEQSHLLLEDLTDKHRTSGCARVTEEGDVSGLRLEPRNMPQMAMSIQESGKRRYSKLYRRCFRGARHGGRATCSAPRGCLDALAPDLTLKSHVKGVESASLACESVPNGPPPRECRPHFTCACRNSWTPQTSLAYCCILIIVAGIGDNTKHSDSGPHHAGAPADSRLRLRGASLTIGPQLAGGQQ